MSPDITMCKGTGAEAFPLSTDIGVPIPPDCPLRKKCYRYLAKPWEYQSWFIGIPYDPKTKTCEYEWRWKVRRRKEDIDVKET